MPQTLCSLCMLQLGRRLYNRSNNIILLIISVKASSHIVTTLQLDIAVIAFLHKTLQKILNIIVKGTQMGVEV